MMFYDFRWIDWNIEKVESHGLSPEEVEYVVNNVHRPYPQRLSGERWIVAGPTPRGIWVQVIYIADPDGTLFVYHARPLNPDEARRARSRT